MDMDDNENYQEDEECESSPNPTPDPLAHLGRPNYSMSDELRHSIREYDPASFQDIYTDALEFDTRLTGFITLPQMNMLCLRHRLPINSSMLRVLFSSFAMDGNMDMVNYEKLIKYLAKVQIGSEKADTLLDEVLNRFMETRGDPIDKSSDLEKHIAKTMHTHDYDDARENKENKTKYKESPRRQKEDKHHHRHDNHNHQSHPEEHFEQPSRKKRSAQGNGDDDKCATPITRKQPIRIFSDREDAKLLMLIEQQCIQGQEETIDMAAMSRTFNEMDRSRLGTVSKKQINEVCLKHRVPVQGSLLDKLLQRCDLGDGQYSWISFVEFLERVQPINMTLEMSPRSNAAAFPPRPGTWPKKERERKHRQETRRNPLIPGTPPEPAAPPWETRKPLGRLTSRKEPTPSPDFELEHIRESPSPTRSAIVGHNGNINDDSYQRNQLEDMAKKHREKRIREMQKKAAKVKKQPEDDQTWFERYRHLAQGLYNADSTNTGFLERSEIRRIINNYNLIYQLGLDETQIEHTITNCGRSDGTVAIEPLLESLRLRAN
uniref:Uncharacterized protein C1orf87-like n=1 Tax=Saccoglossus kowalevskii TaxID=10224 RepID=A0ABM0MC72_SACKO|nr:PREDICTED: uncharacterized protein C1orf87-like [Saccoglossus kowalevskii]